MEKTIGIPRGILYYEFFPVWEEFFQTLGYKIISSPKTNKDILDAGIATCVDEACLPVKIFHGHVDYLKDKVDYIFIPKTISLYKREYCCPKILGLPYMIKNSIDDLPEIIDGEINIDKKGNFERCYRDIGKSLGISRRECNRAYKSAREIGKRYRKWLNTQMPNIPIEEGQWNKMNILLLGHSYNVFDEFMNMGILKKLANKDLNIIVAEDVSEEDIRNYSDQISKRIFWTHGRKIIGSAFSLMDGGGIHGIIYLNSFGCGMDSVLLHIVEQKAIENRIPLMELTLDEQTGEAGFNTRLEAFLDMMKWRKKNEDNIPSFR
ncbi:acyl-CoA dehydratase activase-related protein [Tissierellaceae bacterium HCP3S3_D8]